MPKDIIQALPSMGDDAGAVLSGGFQQGLFTSYP
jgi:hypothetical protein